MVRAAYLFVGLNPQLITGTELIEFICNDNEKDARHLVEK
jgi:hypothetical protein